jgi:hypothetical protein
MIAFDTSAFQTIILLPFILFAKLIRKIFLSEILGEIVLILFENHRSSF